MPDPSPKWKRTKVNAKESINENKVGQKWSGPQACKYIDDDIIIIIIIMFLKG